MPFLPTRSAAARRRVSACAALAVAGLSVAACSTSSTGTGAGAAGGKSSSSTADAAALAAGTKKASGGNPVVVGVLYTDDNPVGDEPEIRDAGLAAQSYINSHGGIGGRTLQVVPCNGKNDPQTDVQCATEFVNDGAVAVQGLDGAWGSAGVAIIGKAGIVNQTEPVSGPEFTSSNAYPWEAENAAAGPALADYVSQTKQTAACIYLDVPALEQGCTGNFQTPAGKLGVNVSLVAVPLSATDVAQYVQRLAQSKAQVCYVALSEPAAVQVIQEAAQVGYKPRWVMPADNARPDFFTTLGAPATGVTFWSDLVLPSDTTNPDTVIYNAAMAKWAPSGTLSNSLTVQTFSNLMTLKRLGDQVGGDKITRADLAHELATIKGVQQFMGHDKLNASVHLPQYPHAVHTGSYLNEWNGSAYVPVGKGYYQVG